MDFLIEEVYKELVENHPSVDRIIPVERSMKPSALLKYGIWLRKEEYDAVLDLQSNGKTGFISWLTGSPRRYGLATGTKFFYSRWRPKRVTDSSHHVENHFQLLKLLGIEEAPGQLQFPEPGKSNLAPERDFVVIHPIFHDPKRNLGIEKWKAIVKFIKSKGMETVLVGTAAEKSFIDLLGEGINLAGKLSLTELRNLIAAAKLFVGMDSGPMHLAATTSTPIIAIFGAGPSSWYRPWREEKVAIIEKNPPCKPCPIRKPCPYEKPFCLEITLEEIKAAIEKFL